MKNVAAALIIDQGHILLTRRAPGENLAGYWEFPGGKQEAGETIQQCIERELMEELSLRCIASTVFMESLHVYERGSINLVGVLVEAQRDSLSLTVHDKAEWVPFSQLLEYKLAPADIPIAEELVRLYG